MALGGPQFTGRPIESGIAGENDSRWRDSRQDDQAGSAARVPLHAHQAAACSLRRVLHPASRDREPAHPEWQVTHGPVARTRAVAPGTRPENRALRAASCCTLPRRCKPGAPDHCTLRPAGARGVGRRRLLARSRARRYPVERTGRCSATSGAGPVRRRRTSGRLAETDRQPCERSRMPAVPGNERRSSQTPE